MGGMKAFAIRLAKMIYIRRLKDNEIVQTLNIPDEDWVRAQIKIVREHPEIYKDMAHAGD
ncbi:MAG: hypothetical protein ACYSW3_02160 [Planctomycetota bacterium]|jgi:hypothetical protein